MSLIPFNFKSSLRKIFIFFFGYGNYIKLHVFLKYKKPITLRLDIAATCNAQCPFCPRVYMDEGRLVGSMDFEKIKSILISAKKYGFKNLKVYITSEPTVHKQFNEIMKFSKELGFTNYVSSNASLIPRAIEGLKYVDHLQISVEGWDKESYEKYRFPLKFDKVYENLKLLNKEIPLNKQNRYIHVPITKKTNLKKFALLWGEFVSHINIDFMQPANIYSGGIMKSEFNDVIKDDYYDFTPFDDNFVCFDPFSEIVVAYDGKIMLCCLDFSASYNLGNIEEGFEILVSNKIRKIIQKQFFTQKLNTCKDCSMFYKPSKDAIKSLLKQVDLINSSNITKAKLITKLNF